MVNGGRSFVILVCDPDRNFGGHFSWENLGEFRKADRYVTVKDSSERQVKSDSCCGR